MMHVHSTHGDDHFTMYISQIIMFHTLNIYSAVCQLYLNKTERKKDYTIYTSNHSEGDMDFSHTDPVHL